MVILLPLAFFGIFLALSLFSFGLGFHALNENSAKLFFRIGGALGITANLSYYVFKNMLTEEDYIPGERYLIPMSYGIALLSIVYSSIKVIKVNSIYSSTKPLDYYGILATAILQLGIFYIALRAFFKLYKRAHSPHKKKQVKLFLIAHIIGYFGVPIVLIVTFFVQLYVLRYVIWVSFIAVASLITFIALLPNPQILYLLPHKMYAIIISTDVGEPIYFRSFTPEIDDQIEISGYLAIAASIFEKIEIKSMEKKKVISVSYINCAVIYKEESVIGVILVERRTHLIENLLEIFITRIHKEFGEKIKKRKLSKQDMERITSILNETLDPILP